MTTLNINQFYVRINTCLSTLETKGISNNQLKKAEVLIDSEKGNIKIIHTFFTATKPKTNQNPTPKAKQILKILKDLTARQKEKECIIFKIFFSIFNSLSIPLTEKMQRYHDIEFYEFPIADQKRVIPNDQWKAEQTPEKRATNSPESSEELMFRMDGYVQQMVQKLEPQPQISLKIWRANTNSEDIKKWFNPEEKREIPKPKPIPFRRPKPEVLEEKSPEKIREGEGSINDPIIAFEYMDGLQK